MMSGDMQVNLRYLSEECDRHGNRRLYVRRHGRRIRVRVGRNDPDFLAAYQAALASLSDLRPGHPSPVKKIAPRGSLGWLAALYFGSEEFKGLQSGPTRRSIIEDCLSETVKDGSSDLIADCPLTYITPSKIKRLRDLKKGLPGAANNRRKYLSAMFGWAVEEGLMTRNPARDVRRIRYATNGFHTWTLAEVCQFVARHPIGTKPYLALCLLLFTGARRSDMVRLGHSNAHGQWLSFVPRKTRYVRHDVSQKPILAPLAAALATGPTGRVTFLETQYGRPFTANGLGNAMRDWCDDAGLPHCTSHGLRKAGATILAEFGATNAQLMAIFDWSSPNQAELYIRAANRKHMAEEAMPLLLAFSREMDGSRTSSEPSIVSPDKTVGRTA